MKRFLAAAFAATLLTGPMLAEARDHDRDSRHERRWERDHDRHARGHRDDKRAHRRDYDHHRDYDHRHVDRHVHRHVDRHLHRHVDRHVVVHRYPRYHVGHYHRPVGYRSYARHRGARLPAAYCAPRYIVHDYHAYDLYRPPHGHHWVRVDGDVVLAAVATGVVVAVVNDLFY